MSKRYENRLNVCVAALSVCLLIICANVMLASEGGQSSYLPGFQDTLAGYLPPPGFYFQEDLYFYTGDIGAAVREGRIEVGLHEFLPMQISIFNQVTKKRILDSYYSWALIVPFAQPKLTGEIVTPLGNVSRSQSVSALAETMIVPIMLGWHNGRSNQKAWITVYAPTGKYNTDSFVNTSLNRWAVEFDYAFTFLDMKTGREFNVAPGYTFNFGNPDTDYNSGQEFHIDFAAIQHLSPKMGIGAVGYIFVQTTADSGSGARLGAFEGRAYALGPIITHNTKFGSVPVSFTGKYYGEFGVTNRFSGHSYWLNIGAAF